MILNEDDQFVFKRSIYLNINWGEDDVKIFNYTIKLLKNDLYLAEKLFTFFSNLEKKDKVIWGEYYKGYEFYPLFLFYMLTVYQLEDFDFFEEDNVCRNFFELEPENVDWGFFEENLNIDYLALDYREVICILETIIQKITSKNKSIFSTLKLLINDNISRIRNDDGDEISVDSQNNIDLLNDLKQKLEYLESKF